MRLLDAPRKPARYGRAAIITAGLVVAGTAVLIVVALAFTSGDGPIAPDTQRFWVGGDSLSYYVGTSLSEDLEARGATSVTDAPDSHRSSGLMSPGFYDWQAHARDIVDADPDLVVLMLGANDAAAAGFDASAYETAASSMMDALDGRTVVWVGVPNMADPAFAARAREANAAARRAARGRPWVHFFDTWELTSADGAYAGSATVGGVRTLLRADDGVHLTPDGGRLIAQAIAAAVGG